MTTRPYPRVPGAPARDLVEHAGDGGPARRLMDAVMKVISEVPSSGELRRDDPAVRARELARQAARSTAGISGSAALVPGPLGVLTLLPDLYAVWKVQTQMVSDIAAVYGKTATLGREQMLYCLFRHMASHLLRDVVVRSGERVLVRRATLQLLQNLASAVGLKLAQRTVTKAVARYAPVIGALGVGGYAYFDTMQVAKTATELFGADLVVLDAETGLPV